MTTESPSATPLALTAVEARVLGCLIEKQALTPESYPLTLNALVTACNQKTSREPVMSLAPGQVGQTLRALEGRGLLRLMMGSRADRWEHRLDKALELVQAQTVLLGLLLLRGPQTLNELLLRSSRMFAFEDTDQLQHHLERLISRELACLVPRQSGQREDRYMHCLGSAEERQAAIAASVSSSPARAEAPADNERLQALEQRVAELEQRLQQLAQQLGE